MNKLSGKTIAILATDGFEQSELFEPQKALESAGAKTEIISDKPQIKAWDQTEWGKTIEAHHLLEEANPNNYDALVLPGGVMSPDKLRTNERALAFIQHFHKSHKVIAAICHAPWLLVEAQLVEGLELTSYPSVRTDILNAGGFWENAEVVIDRMIITSRNPHDIPAFNRAIIDELQRESDANLVSAARRTSDRSGQTSHELKDHQR